MFRCRGLGSMSIPLKLYRAYKLTISIFSIFFSTIWKHCSGLLGTCIFQRNISENENYCQALAGLSALLTRHVDKPRGFKTCTSWMQHEPWIHGSYPIRTLLGLWRHVVGSCLMVTIRVSMLVSQVPRTLEIHD